VGAVEEDIVIEEVGFHQQAFLILLVNHHRELPRRDLGVRASLLAGRQARDGACGMRHMSHTTHIISDDVYGIYIVYWNYQQGGTAGT